MTGHAYVAVDLGASSGRVIAGRLDHGRLRTEETGRFPNVPVRVPTVPDVPDPASAPSATLHWDVLRLWDGVTAGLREAGRVAPVASVGVDTWGVDYGLLDTRGALLANPVHYRDERTRDIATGFLDLVDASASYARTGAQVQAFNTVFQLVAESRTGLLAGARGSGRSTVPGVDGLLLMPDLLTAWLGGRRVAEVTNASTTGLVDPATRRWDPTTLAELRDLTGLDAAPLLAPLVEPGTVLGPVSPGWRVEGADLVAVGSHDTASAVVAVPMTTPGAAYISSGTWSLVGVELDAPVRTEAARAANFTNELGAGGTVRFLRNVAGLWLLQESMRSWTRRGDPSGVAATYLPALVTAAAAVPPLRCVLDVDDPVFAAPGDMPARIAEAARATGQPVPVAPAETVRVVCDSLALAYRRSLRAAADLTGRAIDTVHVVGGGSRNALLCQLTADATGLPVVAGPAEGTAIGNLLVQASALGHLPPDLAALREVVVASHDLVRYEPRHDDGSWDRAERRLGDRSRP